MNENMNLKDSIVKYTKVLFESAPFLLPYKDKLFIAGGCLRSIILGEQVKDLDIFCKDAQTATEIANSGFGFKSDNALNFTIHIQGESTGSFTQVIESIRVQIIHNQVGSPQEIINQFDFTMNMNYYDFETDFINVENIQDILSKTLRVNKHCRNKLGTLARIVKFVERGYKLHSKENLLELGCQISRMSPISTFTELEEESRLYFSDDEYNSIDFVEKDERSTVKYSSRYAGSGL